MSQNTKLNGADYLLLLLFLNNKEPIIGSTRLMKMMFIFNKEIVPLLKKGDAVIPDEALPAFFAYNYGPFSKDVYEQVELFRSINFIQVNNLKADEEMSEADDWEEQSFIDEIESQEDFANRKDGKCMKYEILSLGETYVQQEILRQISKDNISTISDFKKRITHTSPKAILRYVYTKYPDMTQNSLIKDEVLKS